LLPAADVGEFPVEFFDGDDVFGFRFVEAYVGFVRHFMAESFEAVEVLDGPAIFAFGLGPVAEHQANAVRFLCHPAEAFGDAVIAILLAGDFDIAIADHVRVHGDEGIVGSVQDVVEGAGEHAGVEAGAAEDQLLRHGDALDRDEFLSVDRFIAGDSVGLELFDFVEVFEAHNCEGRGAESVFDGIARGA
jgi:hypothetical protein